MCSIKIELGKIIIYLCRFELKLVSPKNASGWLVCEAIRTPGRHQQNLFFKLVPLYSHFIINMITYMVLNLNIHIEKNQLKPEKVNSD